MKKKLQIFISSTYSDLIEERQAAVSAILKAGHIPAGMELFTSGDESQMETIKRWIDESDVFMLILGGRYGSIEPNSSLSYTELEYDYAVKSSKPLFAVVINNSALEQKVKRHGSSVLETENAEKLKSFNKKVLSRVSAFFKDVQDIRLTVYETISDFLVRYDFTGWVSGNEIPDIQSFTEQINKLREENKQLAEDKNALSKGEFFTPSEEREFDHIKQKLDRDISVQYKLRHQKKEGQSEAKVVKELYSTNLLSAIINLVAKGEHRFYKHSIEHLLYEKLNESHPEKAGFKRDHPYRSIKDNLILELQTCGLNKFIEVDQRRFENNLCEFTEKLYRFAYWLEYQGYIPEIHFKLLSWKEETIPEAPKTKNDIPGLPIIKEIDRMLGFKARRNNWRTTEEGVTSALQEFEKLCEALAHKVSEINKKSKAFQIVFSRDNNNCEISSMGVSLSITWSCQNLNTLESSRLSVSGDKARFELEGIQSFAGEDQLFTDEYDIDLNKDLNVIWQNREGKQIYISDALSIKFLTILINAVQDRIVRGK
jgi:hypothetical protein